MQTKVPADPVAFDPGRAAQTRQHTPTAVVPFLASTGSSQHPGTRSGPKRDRFVLLELEGCRPGAVFSVGGQVTLIGRRASADIRVADSTVSWDHARLTVDRHGVQLEDLSSRNGTFINDLRIRQRTPLEDGDYLRLGNGSTLLKFSLMSAIEERAHRTLFELTLRDPLTRLYNRRYFDDRLRNEFAFAQGHSTLLALLLVDIDHFKRINDTRGHQVGDIVLKLVANSIQKMMRPEDVLARYGGDEFVVIARATSLRNVEILGDRLCHRIEAMPLALPGHELSVTVSVGVSCTDPEAPSPCLELLIGAADEALYRAKATGRGRVCV